MIYTRSTVIHSQQRIIGGQKLPEGWYRKLKNVNNLVNYIQQLGHLRLHPSNKERQVLPELLGKSSDIYTLEKHEITTQQRIERQGLSELLHKNTDIFIQSNLHWKSPGIPPRSNRRQVLPKLLHRNSDVFIK